MRPYLPLLSSLVLVASLVGCGASVGIANPCGAEGDAPAGEAGCPSPSPKAGDAGPLDAGGGPPSSSPTDAAGPCDPSFVAARCDHLFACHHPNGDAAPLNGYQAECATELFASGLTCPAHVTGYCLTFISTEDCSITNAPTSVPPQCTVGL